MPFGGRVQLGKGEFMVKAAKPHEGLSPELGITWARGEMVISNGCMIDLIAVDRNA